MFPNEITYGIWLYAKQSLAQTHIPTSTTTPQ